MDLYKQEKDKLKEREEREEVEQVISKFLI
jgi:hypothetical protein